MIPSVGLPEILIVLVIALVVLGPKRLPEVGKSLGRGMREFKDSISGDNKRDQDELESGYSATTAQQPGRADSVAETERKTGLGNS